MTRTPEPFESLLASRARIAWGVSAATPRPCTRVLAESSAELPAERRRGARRLGEAIPGARTC